MLIAVSVLMGYGFCLESNQADSFNLSYSPALSQHIEAAKAHRNDSGQSGYQQEVSASTSEMLPSAMATNNDENRSSTSPSAGASPVKDVKFVTFGGSDHQFCPGFLGDCSLALQNGRERKHDMACSPSIVRFSNDTLSRNKLHTLSSIIMILQQKQLEIRQHDKTVPSVPQNRNQEYASIYRSSQLKILEGVLGSLSITLQSIMQLRLAEQPRIIRLVDILKRYPKALKSQFREVVRVGVRTREASKVVERRGVRFAFTVWLCGLRLLQRAGHLRRTDPVLSQWIEFLCKHYDDHAINEYIHNGAAEYSVTSKAEEIAETVRTYVKAVQTAAERHPDSIYNDEWAHSQSNLTWCFVVVREEGVRCPTITESGISGEEEDEFVLVIDAEEAGEAQTENKEVAGRRVM